MCIKYCKFVIIVFEVNVQMHYLGTTAARLKLKGIDGGLVSSGGACGLIRFSAPNLTRTTS